MRTQSNFSQRLRQLRQALGLSCNEVGRRAGVAPGMVSRFERFERAPNLETARKLARALGEESLACWD